ncbi:metallophosphoesterase family protein [Burkholderia vietnamiensis]|uniref:metallophosphoesterase family protein n=1 Tax=Burkholderia vietnamiensis TaxID=60552 RepID=UPI001ADA2694|nr:metallophosphatase family protein [Burkholderia vietnamiensis]MBR8191566.1 metallophosphatase family protein [Burkholderia vietnamiensis]QTK86118.1 metallophosphatase family protein [Burkholderia vietnamiensis]
MKIAHFSDLHYSPENVDEADRCFRFAVDDAIARGARMAVISGDSTDHRLDAHSPALHALATQVHRLAAAMPVVMLQGTFSHEPRGTLDNFALMGAQYPVFVADRICQVAMRVDGAYQVSAGPVFDEKEIRDFETLTPDVVFSCLPTINKGDLALKVGALSASTSLGEVLSDYLLAAGQLNRRFRSMGIPTVGISHGTVNGCTTEHGVTMAGFDHEFGLGALFEAECSAFMLGHIHKHQCWDLAGRRVAYPGSIGRFHYGKEGDKGYLVWAVSVDGATSDLVTTPAREMVYLEFDGVPDPEKLAALAADSAGKFVRIRWQIDEEHRQLVDRKAIEAMFVGAAGLKLEPRVLPVVRSRAEGISKEITVDAKVARWCELSGVAAPPVLERLQLLDTGDADAIAAAVLDRLAQSSGPAVDQIIDSADDPMLPTVDALPTALVETVQQPSPSWLDDDLFAA